MRKTPPSTRPVVNRISCRCRHLYRQRDISTTTMAVQRSAVSRKCMSRSASTLLEATTALFVMAVIFAMIAQLTVFSARQWQRNTQRRLGLQLAANTIDQLMAAAWDELHVGDSSDWEIPAETSTMLPQAQVAVSIVAVEDVVSARHIRVQVSWSDGPVAQPQRVSLSSWRFATPLEAAP